MTDNYTKLRKYLYLNVLHTVGGAGIPFDLQAQIGTLFSKDREIALKYNTNSFNEEDWAKIKQVCDLYDSPLWKALK